VPPGTGLLELLAESLKVGANLPVPLFWPRLSKDLPTRFAQRFKTQDSEAQ
jgi:hypothetical protein